MHNRVEMKSRRRKSASVTLLIVASLLFMGVSCKTKKRVSVSPLLAPLVKAEAPQLFAEINRMAAVVSMRGKIDLQFLDTSFAECGLVEKYRTADGDVILQRPGQVYLAIKAPFGVKIAEMTSDGGKFWVAIYQGDEKYRRFVQGTNEATYGKLASEAGEAAPNPCPNGDGKLDKEAMERTVSSLSSLRPQHLTDALMVRPVSGEGGGLVYAQAEEFVEELDTRAGAKKDARVVRGYYILTELAPQGEGRARITRRFWFDRVGGIRLARVQNYDEGQLITDVVYRDARPFGAESQHTLPVSVEITRPQDRYSVRISFQSPGEVVLDKQFDPDIFVLQNTSDLPAVDLDNQVK